jgi:hypothetical protein
MLTPAEEGILAGRQEAAAEKAAETYAEHQRDIAAMLTWMQMALDTHEEAAQTPVTINIAQGLAVAEGVIVESRWDDGWMYRVDLAAGDDCREHRHEDGQLWACDVEVTAREA